MTVDGGFSARVHPELHARYGVRSPSPRLGSRASSAPEAQR